MRPLYLLLALATGCPPADTGSDSDTDTEPSTEADSDSDTDAGTEPDSDTEADTEYDVSDIDTGPCTDLLRVSTPYLHEGVGFNVQAPTNQNYERTPEGVTYPGCNTAPYGTWTTYNEPAGPDVRLGVRARQGDQIRVTWPDSEMVGFAYIIAGCDAGVGCYAAAGFNRVAEMTVPETGEYVVVLTGYDSASDPPAYRALVEVVPQEDCGNFIDDDGDGFIDCTDAGCHTDPACVDQCPIAGWVTRDEVLEIDAPWLDLV